MLDYRSRRACGLRFSYLRQRQSSADGNYIEDGVCGIGWHPQPVKPFPRTNANVGRVRVRPLLGELTPSPLLTLMLFLRKALGGRMGR
jgi:hypothetical protein